MDHKYRELPIFKKAHEIMEITKAITDCIDPKDDRFEMRQQMMSNAYLIPAKIAGAQAVDLYSIQMENAVLIKIAACELKVQTNMLKAEELADPTYIKLLRDEVDNFKVLFVEWVKTFDPSEDANDGWLYITPPRDQDIEEGF